MFALRAGLRLFRLPGEATGRLLGHRHRRVGVSTGSVGVEFSRIGTHVQKNRMKDYGKLEILYQNPFIFKTIQNTKVLFLFFEVSLLLPAAFSFFRPTNTALEAARCRSSSVGITCNVRRGPWAPARRGGQDVPAGDLAG